MNCWSNNCRILGTNTTIYVAIFVFLFNKPMKNLLSLTLYMLLLAISTLSYAQQTPQDKVQLSGYISSTDEATPLAGVHIMNNKSRVGAISDEKGFFVIPMHRTDTILFSAVGYETYTLVLDPESQSSNPLVQIRLTLKTYQLEQVDVRAIPTETKFKKDFLALELPDQPILALPEVKGLKLAESVYTLPEGGIAISGPFSAIYSKFSREAKELKKANALFSAEARKNAYKAKFNAGLVQQVTGLKDVELEEFMKYCKLSESQVLNARNEYEIVLAINDCYKSFKETKKLN